MFRVRNKDYYYYYIIDISKSLVSTDITEYNMN